MRMFAIALALLVAAAMSTRADAIEIQRVVSPGGIEAWLVEEHAIPIVAVSFAVPGGAYHDPEGKSGIAYLLSATLDEGAGDLDSQAFRDRIDEHAISLSFDADRDQFSGELETLSEHRDVAFDLMRQAITIPRFDPLPVERMKSQLLTKINRDATDPGDIASDAWFRAAFGQSGYGRRLEGTAESMAALTPDDLKDFHARLLALDGMKIAVVGDISADELGPLLDETFGALPRKSGLEPIGKIAAAAGPKVIEVDFDAPQTELRFGMPGLERADPDFIPAFVMNYILGGGGFSSRLYEEVREKRGLSYSVTSYIYPLRGTGIIYGGAGTRGDRAAETLGVIRNEFVRMAAEGPSEEELDAAKKYLTGAYPLRFDSNSKIASQLVGIQIEDLGIDYVDRRNGLIEAVTIEDVRRVARDLLKPDQMIVVAVGRKQSIEAIGSGG